MAGFIQQMALQQPQQQQQSMQQPGFAPQGFAPQGAPPAAGGFVQQAPPGTAPHSPQMQQQPQQAPAQPQIVQDQSGAQYVVTPTGYVPLAQWQAQNQPRQLQQPQQQPMMPQQVMQPNGQVFQQQTGQQGFVQAPMGAPQNGFGGQQQQQGFAQNGFGQQQQQQQQPVGGFASNGAPFNGQQQQNGFGGGGGGQQQQNNGWNGGGVSFEQFMGGMGEVQANDGGRIYFRGDGTHLCEITKVSNGVGKTTMMPFFSVEFRVLHSTSPNNPPGYTPTWTESISDGRMLKRMMERVKAFLKLALAVKGMQIPDAQITAQTAAWAGSVDQPLKGLVILVNTREQPNGPNSKNPGGVFTQHSFAPPPPGAQRALPPAQMQQNNGFAPQQQNFAPQGQQGFQGQQQNFGPGGGQLPF